MPKIAVGLQQSAVAQLADMTKMRLYGAASLLMLLVAVPSLAQDVTKRVDTLEGQMRAVQRKVFPGGNPKYFEPEFPQGQQAAGDAAADAPASTTAIADINVRLQALERQIAETTGRQEQIENRTRTLEEQFRKFKEDIEFRLNGAGSNTGPAVQTQPSTPTPPVAVPVPEPVPTAKPAPVKPVAPKPAAPLPPSTQTVPIKPMPAASDAPYQAAYAAYQAKRYEDAISMFETFVNRNPKHPLASNALFWQGKAYSAKQQHGLAARSYLRGYDRYREGSKAEDNLLGLAESLVAVGRREQACEALGEFQAVFKTPAAANRAKAETLRRNAKCP
jgi:tol-pal system protein YbgF